MKHLKFLAALCCMLAVFAACNNNNDPKDPNDPNSVEEESYDCDSTEMICTGRAYDITPAKAKIADTVHIPITLLADCSLGVQLSLNKEDLMEHANVRSATTKNLTGNDFMVTFGGLWYATTYYYCAYIYLNGVYHYGIIREFTTQDIITGTANGHEYVDLGLPSGLKWATCNVGATKPEEYGNYYAWGETEPKTTYSWSTYKWCKDSYDTQTKYCTDSDYGRVDNKTVLELADDAARANWGGAWRMPTYAAIQELRSNCSMTWTSDYNGTGVRGLIVTSNTNGNHIFLPAAGYRVDDGLSDAFRGYYWSSSLYTYNPYSGHCVYFQSDGEHGYDGLRCCGLSVRPVL